MLTGFAAASIMVEGKAGILRTLPAPPDYAIARLRRTARALGIDWPSRDCHPDLIGSLDASRPEEARARSQHFEGRDPRSDHG
jgi:exoribonuclease R